MPTIVTIDTQDFDRVRDIISRRADSMVPDALGEGETRAQSIAQQGYQHRYSQAAHRRYVWRRRVIRGRHATGALIAHMQESVLYHRFIDFWGDW